MVFITFVWAERYLILGAASATVMRIFHMSHTRNKIPACVCVRSQNVGAEARIDRPVY